METRNEEETIVATVDQTEVTVTLDEFRQLLHLPASDFAGRVRFSQTLTDEQILREIHDLGHNGEVVHAMDFTRGKLQPVWYTFFTILNRCLSSKTKGIHKGTTTFYHLFHAVAYDRHVDYVRILWLDITKDITSKHSGRKSGIPFMRFFQIIIKAHMDNYPEIRRRSRYPLAPNYKMESIRATSLVQGIPNLQIPEAVLRYANPTHAGVSAYKDLLGLEVVRRDRPEPTRPT